MKHLLRRFSIYGDFWLRYLHWGTRHCPWFMEPLFVLPFTLMFWVLLGKGRRAVAGNLAVILPGSSPVANQARVFRVFWNFAWTLVDLAHVRHGEDCIRWEIAGSEHLDALVNRHSGAILLTAHMGNYDVAAPLFAQKIHRPIHLVRAPERERESQEFQQGKRERQTGDSFVVHYNEPGNMVGVELAHALHDGGIVAIQGDRILFDVSPLGLAFKDGVEWRLPRGPFMLALVGRTVIHPVFIIRMGWRRYRVQAEPVIEPDLIGRDRERSLHQAASRWNHILRRVIEQHWRQWFIFEPVFERKDSAPADAGEKLNADDTKDAPVNLVISPQRRHAVAEVFGWNALVGGWTSAVVLRRLLEWAVGDSWHVLMVVIAWPVIWFVAMLAVVQAALGVALLLLKVARLPESFYDKLACGLTLATFSGIAWMELRSGCHVGWWLGVIWLATLGPGLVWRALLAR